MDKNAIKKYAVWARNELIARVTQKALKYGITAEDPGDPNAKSIGDTLLTDTEVKQRAALIAQIKEKGFEQVMEEVSYTWFNRFAALRFMEVNGYLPSHVRVFTDDNNAFKPQILTEAIHLELDGLDMDKVYELKNENRTEELFQYLLIVQCNALNAILPGMFQKIADYTELLLPDYLLREGSVAEQMVAQIAEDDWKDQVQIIGWLYQYYNSEPKDKVFADLKKNIKITKEKIPAATQLFTPDWIVHYMVENSLGRLWLEGHPNDELKSEWKYYLDEAEQEPEVEAKLVEIRKEYAALKPEEIRVIDPCQGSGHILCVLFDTLVKIYEDYGYTAREAAAGIVENNIWGLDIDERASQLAYFSVMMKARQYDRRFFSREVQPHVYAIQESNNLDQHAIEYFVDGREELKSAMDTLIEELHDAKEYGSILNVSQVDFDALYARVDEIKNEAVQNMYSYMVEDVILTLVQVGQALAQKYDAIVTNPPYMGFKGMNDKMSAFVKKYYFDYKSDLFSSFIVKCIQMTKKNGFAGFLSPYVWMFIQSYEKLRNKILHEYNIQTLIQFEYSAFEEATVPICTFVLQNTDIKKSGVYLRLTDFRGGMTIQEEKALQAINGIDRSYYYESTGQRFEVVPGSPIAYWVSNGLFEDFKNGTLLKDIAEPKSGLSTTDNNRFLRYWYEVAVQDISFGVSDISETEIGTKWYPMAKGGDYRKWFGNNEYVVNWYLNGRDIKEATKGAAGGRIVSPEYYFKKFVTWSGISSAEPSMRISDKAIFGSGAKALFSDSNLMEYLAFLNSKVSLSILQFLSPTLNFEAGHIGNIPICFSANEGVAEIANTNISISRMDWNSFETSWDFQRHPLIRAVSTLSDAYIKWEQECTARFFELKKNEEELNRIFIDIYGLQNELMPEIEDKDITVRKADLQRDIRSLLSYAVGCMFGRYSLDVPGLAYAGGTWDASKYTTFQPDKDAILPICDDEYFEDDIVVRFVEFIEVVYGKETLEENLKFIADALGGKGTSREVIRNYFMNDFYADHLKIYQKRPIYWLFDSGKKNGFKCLVYMHRYQPDTIARIRTDYVHEMQSRYRTATSDLEKRIESAGTGERVKLNKRLTTLQAQADELRKYEEKIHHLADQMIPIDLDDGVKHNYEIFKDVLAKIK